jgi:hypothetical protein
MGAVTAIRTNMKRPLTATEIASPECQMSIPTDNRAISDQRQIRNLAVAEPRGSRAKRAVLNLGFVVGSVLVALTSAIHLHLWADGYRSIPVVGPLFLVQGIAGAVLALALIGWRRMLTAVVGTGFMLSTVGGLLISVNFGLFGFMDSLAAPFAGVSLVVEIAGALVLGLIGAFVLTGALKSQTALNRPNDENR